MKDCRNYPLLEHNTFGMNVKAERFIEYESVEELLQIIASGVLTDSTYFHIGSGSNLLFCQDYDGVILHSAIKGFELVDETDDDVLVRVGAGENFDDFVAYAVEHGWGGAENLSIIPGEVGASAVQNIGAYGAEAREIIQLVEAIDCKTGIKRVFGNVECAYAYRQSIFKNELKGKYAITHVTFRLQKHPVLKLEYGNLKNNPDIHTIADVRKAIIDIRNAKLPDPKLLGNAGSFFMNPVVSEQEFLRLKSEYPDIPSYPASGGIKVPAGWLIEKAGWKGRALGRAAVHKHQALVLVNLGGADSSEIVALSDAVCKSVFEQFGVDIHPEVNFIGRNC